MEQNVSLTTQNASLAWRIFAAAVFGGCLGAAGAWLEQFVDTFWIAVLLLPVAFLLEVVLEIGTEALGHGKRMLRPLVITVVVSCYIVVWVAWRG